MICRLCLNNLEMEHSIKLFDTTSETRLIKIIAKFFLLEITYDDTISTTICKKCNDYLEDFYAFWVYVDSKQTTLQEKQITIKHDVDGEQVVSNDNIVSGSLSGNGSNQDELLLDINNLQMPLEICINESVIENPDTNSSQVLDDINALDSVSDPGLNNYSTDDDVPLLQLKTKPKKKKKAENSTNREELVSKKARKTQHNIEIIDKSMDLSCDLCKASLEGYVQLRSHFSENHSCAPYVKCCSRNFTTPSKLIEHINWHNSLFKCDICGKELRSAHRLIAHKKSFHSIKDDKIITFKCNTCKKRFPNEKDLENHSTVCNEEVLPCTICKKEYIGEKWLKNHMKKEHGHKKEEKFTCQSCGKVFPTAQRMQRHFEAIHEKVYYHICDVCGKKFRFKPSFQKHILEHQGIVEPTMQCNLCGQWLKNAQALRLHQMRHDTANVDCQYCGKKCISRKALVGHINYRHKLKKDLQCKFCDKTFKETRNLGEHMAIHTGAQLYSCPHCSKECRSRSNMYVHIKRNHVQEWIASKAARSNDPNLNTKLKNQNQLLNNSCS